MKTYILYTAQGFKFRFSADTYVRDVANGRLSLIKDKSEFATFELAHLVCIHEEKPQEGFDYDAICK